MTTEIQLGNNRQSPESLNDPNREQLKNRLNLFVSIFKGKGYKLKNNLLDIKPPYFIFFKKINRNDHIIIDLILVRVVRKRKDYTVEIEDELYNKTKDFRRSIRNLGLKIDPNSKNVDLAFFSLLKHLELKQVISYYKTENGSRKQQIYKIRPLIIHLENQEKVIWQNRLDTKLGILGLNAIGDLLSKRFDKLVSEENDVKNKKIFEKLLSINYKIENLWIIYLIPTVIITITNYNIQYPEIFTNLFSFGGFILFFSILYGSCVSTRFLMFKILRTQIENEMKEITLPEADLGEIIIQDNQVINEKRRDTLFNNRAIENPIRKKSYLREQFRNKYKEFLNIIEDKDLKKLKEIIPDLIEIAVSSVYISKFTQNISDVKIMYQKIYESNSNSRMLSPSVFNNLMGYIPNISTWRTFEKIELLLIKIFETLGTIRKSNPEISVVEGNENQIKGQEINRNIYFDKAEQLMNQDKSISSKERLDIILNACIEKKFGTMNVYNLSFYRNIIRREISQITITEKLKLIYSTNLKTHFQGFENIIKDVNTQNKEVSEELKQLWINLKSSLWNITSKEKVYNNEIEQKQVQDKQILLNNSNLDLDSIVSYWQSAQILKDEHFQKAYILGYEAVENLTKLILQKNNADIKSIRTTKDMHKFLNDKGYNLLNLESICRLRLIYTECKKKSVNISENGMKKRFNELDQYYQMLLTQIDGPQKISRKDENKKKILVQDTTAEDLINEIQDSKAQIGSEFPSKDILGLFLLHFDENYGFISKYHRCTEEEIDPTFLNSLIHEGLSYKESEYFNFRLYNHECAGKRFHVQNPNKRGNIDIYSFIIFSSKEEIKNIDLHEIVDAFINDIKNHEDILDKYFDKILKRIFPNISKLEPNLPIKDTESKIQEIPEEIIEDEKANDNILDAEILNAAIELDTTMLEQYIQQKDFLNVFIINRSFNPQKQLLREYIGICKQFHFDPYFYDDAHYPVLSNYHVSSPAIMIIDNNEIKSLDLMENKQEKLDELRRILDRRTTNFEDDIQEIAAAEILNGSDKEITYIKENSQWNINDINDINEICVEISAKEDAEINEIFKNYKYDLTPYNPQNNDYSNLSIHFIFYATDSMELKEKKYYILMQKISERLDIPISILFLRNYNSIMPKLEPCTPPAVYIHYKKDGKLEKKYVEFNEDEKYIIKIVKILNEYDNINLCEENNSSINEKINEFPNFTSVKPDYDYQVINFSDEKYIVSKIQDFIGYYIILVLCHKDNYKKIKIDFEKKTENLEIPKVLCLSDHQSILYFKVPNDLSNDINFHEFIPNGLSKLEYNDIPDFNKKLNLLLNKIREDNQ